MNYGQITGNEVALIVFISLTNVQYEVWAVVINTDITSAWCQRLVNVELTDATSYTET